MRQTQTEKMYELPTSDKHIHAPKNSQDTKRANPLYLPGDGRISRFSGSLATGEEELEEVEVFTHVYLQKSEPKRRLYGKLYTLILAAAFFPSS